MNLHRFAILLSSGKSQRLGMLFCCIQKDLTIFSMLIYFEISSEGVKIILKFLFQKFKNNKYLNLLILGVPRYKRGDVWIFCAEQYRLTNKVACEVTDSEFSLNTPYSELVSQLTTQQHAILTDLGRCIRILKNSKNHLNKISRNF